MPLSDIVNVVITTANPGVTLAGFGVPLITSHHATWAERTRVYGNTTAVAADFALNTPEYLAAAAVFSQQPAPPQVIIGRCANHPTQVHQIAILTVGASGTKYSVRINNLTNGGNSQTVTYTAGASETNDNIVAQLATLINALTGMTLTATATGTVGAHVLTLTANAPGNWNGVEAVENAGQVGQLMQLTETTADAGISADLTALANASSAWYGLVTLYKSLAIVEAASAWAETNNKLYVAAVADTVVANEASGTTTTPDVAQALSGLSHARTALFFHPRNDEFADAAEVGRFFPVTPGGDNWRLKTLSGVTPANYTPTQITNMNAKYVNFYYNLAGANVVGGEGKVTANEYIDVIRFRDSWSADVQERLANLLIQNNKVPFTDAGVGLVEAEVRGANDDGVRDGGISPNPRPTVTAPLVANVSAADKSARTLRNVNTTWTLAGALNHLTVNAAVLF